MSWFNIANYLNRNFYNHINDIITSAEREVKVMLHETIRNDDF